MFKLLYHNTSFVSSWRQMLTGVTASIPLIFISTQAMSTIISVDTVWRSSDHIVLSQKLQIAYGATLTVLPGATIDGNGNQIEVQGSLKIGDIAGAKVTMSALHIGYLPNNDPDYPANIDITNVVWKGGSLHRPTGAATYGRFSLQGSWLDHASEFTYLWYPTGDCLISGNLFTSFPGFSIGSSDPVIKITYNTFSDFLTRPAVSMWVDYGLPGLFVNNNNFFGNPGIALETSTYAVQGFDARWNYFGTTNRSAIARMVNDSRDDLSRKPIAVNPFLTSAASSAPAYLSSAGDVSSGTSGADMNHGAGGNDRLSGGSKNDLLIGGAGADFLAGGGDHDYLDGGEDGDTLTGGPGADRLAGGPGADRFVYYALVDGDNAGNRDLILDFEPGVDRIDFSRIDANTRLTGNQSFSFIGTRPLSGIPGQLKHVIRDYPAPRRDLTLLVADVDGDKLWDLEVRLSGKLNIGSNSLIP